MPPMVTGGILPQATFALFALAGDPHRMAAVPVEQIQAIVRPCGGSVTGARSSAPRRT